MKIGSCISRVLAGIVMIGSVMPIAIEARQAQKPPVKERPPRPEIVATDKPRVSPPQPKPAFNVDPIAEQHGYFTLMLADQNNRTAHGAFRRDQLQIFDAVLYEAIRFGKNEEEVGKTTRIADATETGLVVDVEKAPRKTTFHVTLSFLKYRLTINAGSIIRGVDKNEEIPLVVELQEAIRNAVAAN
jgi:hypothetical protein